MSDCKKCKYIHDHHMFNCRGKVIKSGRTSCMNINVKPYSDRNNCKYFKTK